MSDPSRFAAVGSTPSTSQSKRESGMSHMTYRQAELERDDERRIAWLPLPYAKLGKVLDLRDFGEWSRGWTVIWVGRKFSGDFIEARTSDHRKQRLASDV